MLKLAMRFLIPGLIAAVFPLYAEQQVFLKNFPPNTPQEKLTGFIRTFDSDSGLKFDWSNPEEDNRSASIAQYQCMEDVTAIRLTGEITRNQGTLVFLEISDTDENIYRTRLALPEKSGAFDLILHANDFQRIRDGKSQKRFPGPFYEPCEFSLIVSGAKGSAIAGVLTVAKAETAHTVVPLFEPRLLRNIFGQSYRYQRPLPQPSFDNRPRVFIADNGRDLSSDVMMDSMLKLSSLFPAGTFGVDMNGHLFPRVSTAAKFYQDHGIKVMFESHPTWGVHDYFTNNGVYLTAEDGFTMNDPSQWERRKSRGPWPEFCLDTTDSRAMDAYRILFDELQRDGIGEFLFIDYTWAWPGRWGFGKNTLQAFRRDLLGTDDGLRLAGKPGVYRTFHFWDYLGIFTDVKITPNQLGIKSFEDYIPVAEADAYRSPRGRFNYFLYFALYHYEYLKYLERVGAETDLRGIALIAGSNPEHIANGNDNYLAGRVKGVHKFGYEFFESPLRNRARYHNMRYFSGSLARVGKQLHLIAEINVNAHGPSDLDVASSFAYFYDVTSAAKPADYNNQYMLYPWNGKPINDLHHHKRFAQWLAGAYAYLLSMEERSALPDIRPMAVIASRSILEEVDGSSACLRQINNPSAALDALHIPFDVIGKEWVGDDLWAEYSTLFFAPAQASPMHFRRLGEWLRARPSRTLITHSAVPFSVFDGQMNNWREQECFYPSWRDAAGFQEWKRSNPKAAESLLPLRLAKIEPDAKLSFHGIEATRPLYTLANGKVVVSDDHGMPLISRFDLPNGSRILYIHARLAGFGQPADESIFSIKVLAEAMKLAGGTPEAEAGTDVSIHLYDVPGGKSAVIWGRNELPPENSRNYPRVKAKKPYPVAFIAEPNRDYVLYQVFEDRLLDLNSGRDGRLCVTMPSNCEVYYFGRRDDAEFQKTLKRIREVRIKLNDWEQNIVQPK